ncbi:unnamed protein product [Ceutorhynchus assimilis]|uniref:FHA domain-containing protein n=1 Tax=Ceutorhynchus assimilis TaxID=467358 RepID=A0A9N9MPI7_9CUCU|nr:unnamed protein product [Ceutorhynchus assimilis]
MPLPSELLTPEDIEEIYRVLESPRNKTPRAMASMIKPRAMLCPIVSEHFYNIRSRDVNPADVKHDASFMGYRPTVSARFPEAVPMIYKVLSVGKGLSNNVDLLKFGYCNYIAPHHATIYFDEDAKCFELINYAPRGTHVNNIWYCNDVNTIYKSPVVSPETFDEKMHVDNLSTEEKDATQVVDMSSQATSEESQVASQVVYEESPGQGAICRRKKYRLEHVPSAKRPNPEQTDRVECACGTSMFEIGQGEEIKNCSEDSVILGHGNLISFGCISFVFSIIDQVH